MNLHKDNKDKMYLKTAIKSLAIGSVFRNTPNPQTESNRTCCTVNSKREVS